MMKKKISITFLMSMLVFLLTFWIAGYSFYAAALTEAVSFYVLTYFILENYAERQSFGLPYIIAIVLGRIILELPIRITEFPETLFSLFIPIVVFSSIFLAALYFKEKRISVLVLSVIILILLSTIGQMEWLNAFHYGK